MLYHCIFINNLSTSLLNLLLYYTRLILYYIESRTSLISRWAPKESIIFEDDKRECSSKEGSINDEDVVDEYIKLLLWTFDICDWVGISSFSKSIFANAIDFDTNNCIE